MLPTHCFLQDNRWPFSHSLRENKKAKTRRVAGGTTWREEEDIYMRRERHMTRKRSREELGERERRRGRQT